MLWTAAIPTTHRSRKLCIYNPAARHSHLSLFTALNTLNLLKTSSSLYVHKLLYNLQAPTLSLVLLHSSCPPFPLHDSSPYLVPSHTSPRKTCDISIMWSSTTLAKWYVGCPSDLIKIWSSTVSLGMCTSPWTSSATTVTPSSGTCRHKNTKCIPTYGPLYLQPDGMGQSHLKVTVHLSCAQGTTSSVVPCDFAL